jgi:hypothetical protein
MGKMISFKDFRKKIGDGVKKVAKAAAEPVVKPEDVELYVNATETLKRAKHDPKFKPGMDPFKFDGSKIADHLHKKLYGESEELDEATFVADSPATYGSRGTKFEVQKNKEKSTGTHVNGQPVEHHDVYHGGKHIGHVASYSGYKDKKPAGSRIVTSRKDVRLWRATIHGGEHNRHGSVFNTTPAGSQYTGTGFASKKDALQHLADAHNSNKNR